MTRCGLWFIIMLLVGHNTGKMNNMEPLIIKQWLPVEPFKAAGLKWTETKGRNLNPDSDLLLLLHLNRLKLQKTNK